MNLTHKTIFITGGASGIGRECVTAYLRAGARVGVLDRDENALSELKTQFGNDVLLALQGDVRQKEDIKTAIEETVAAFGSLHVIHNNAGIASPSKPLHETSEDEWNSLFDINLKSVFYTTKYGLEYLRQTRGNILNTSSMVGEIGQNNHAAYVASKGGMSALTKAMALDYAPLGIRVNAVCPFYSTTPMVTDSEIGERQDFLAQGSPMKRLGRPDEIVATMLMLCAKDNTYLTGQAVAVDGGVSAF